MNDVDQFIAELHETNTNTSTNMKTNNKCASPNEENVQLLGTTNHVPTVNPQTISTNDQGTLPTEPILRNMIPKVNIQTQQISNQSALPSVEIVAQAAPGTPLQQQTIEERLDCCLRDADTTVKLPWLIARTFSRKELCTLLKGHSGCRQTKNAMVRFTQCLFNSELETNLGKQGRSSAPSRKHPR